MKILILAQNPKRKANVTEPLKGTKSWSILERWLKEAGIPLEDVELSNAFDAVGDRKIRVISSNVIQLKRWVPEIIEFPVIVCLGRIPADAVRFTREAFFPNVQDWDHFFLPHPSGLNRKLNDPEEHRKVVRQLKAAHKKLLTLRLYERII